MSGPVRVPKEAGKGMAKITLSIAGWKGKLAPPVTYEVPVADATPPGGKRDEDSKRAKPEGNHS